MPVMTLSDWMLLRKLTDEEVAAMVDTDRSRINRIRRGVALPSLGLAKRIKEVSAGAVTADDYEYVRLRNE
jgi:transcriptional regulator with XRE-family HTH domain